MNISFLKSIVSRVVLIYFSLTPNEEVHIFIFHFTFSALNSNTLIKYIIQKLPQIKGEIYIITSTVEDFNNSLKSFDRLSGFLKGFVLLIINCVYTSYLIGQDYTFFSYTDGIFTETITF